jgi:hypothetical protein
LLCSDAAIDCRKIMMSPTVVTSTLLLLFLLRDNVSGRHVVAGAEEEEVVDRFLSLVERTIQDVKEYCHDEDFAAECPDGHVILMTSAHYGRMALGKCVRMDFGFVGCHVDVIAYAHERCSGRRSCSILVRDATLYGMNACSRDLKNYLSVSYKCVKVAGYEDDTCSLSATGNDTVGYLLNRRPTYTPTRQKLCGTDLDPWVINVLPGQRINIRLLDFTASNTRLQSDRMLSTRSRSTVTTTATTLSSPTEAPCDRYAVVVDNGNEVEVCGEKNHLQRSALNEHMSLGSSVKLVLHHFVTEDERQLGAGYNFLLRYEAVGCPDLVTPSNVWIKRQSNRITIGCVTSEVTWTLKCVGMQWQGTEFNLPLDTDVLGCSAAATVPENLLGLTVAIIAVLVVPLGSLTGI